MVSTSPAGAHSVGSLPYLPVVDAARYALAARLLDSLLHEVRNPLNAIGLNLEVLAQKLKLSAGGPASPEKNVSSIREQVGRADQVLRAFAEFIAPKRKGSVVTNFSELVRSSVELLGHESRKGRVQLKPALETDIRVKLDESSHVNFLALQPLLRAIARSSPGSEVTVTLKREGRLALLKVVDNAPNTQEPFAFAVEAMTELCRSVGGHVVVSGAECLISIPAE